jgi:muramoyltetrapeptide carboxypeptidase
MLKPPRLRQGDKIAIVSPASAFSREEFDKGVEEIRRLGFEPVFEESVFAQHGGYLSGEAHVRAQGFLSAWRDPSVRALIAVRGGYGSVHVLPFLEREDLRRAPKAFIGYSDLTTVLSYLTGSCGIVSFHGPMLDRRLSRGVDAYDRDSFVRALTSAEPLGEVGGSQLEIVNKGEAAGLLMAGRWRSWWRRSERRMRSIRQPVTCCLSKTWESGRSESIGCSPSCVLRASWIARLPSCWVRSRIAMSLAEPCRRRQS